MFYDFRPPPLLNEDINNVISLTLSVSYFQHNRFNKIEFYLSYAAAHFLSGSTADEKSISQDANSE